MSRLILSMIKALLGEGMKRSGGRRGEPSALGERWAEGRAGGQEGERGDVATDAASLRGLMRKYVKGGKRSPGAWLSISGGPALAPTHMSGPARRSVLCLSWS